MRFSKYALYTNIDTVDWNKKEKVEEWRSSWAEHANRYLENWKPISFFFNLKTHLIKQDIDIINVK